MSDTTEVGALRYMLQRAGGGYRTITRRRYG
jgi:hypothetical protein